MLTVDLQLAIYRSLIEAVSLLLELESGQVSVRARSARLATAAALWWSWACLTAVARCRVGPFSRPRSVWPAG